MCRGSVGLTQTGGVAPEVTYHPELVRAFFHADPKTPLEHWLEETACHPDSCRRRTRVRAPGARHQVE
jgi:hypothetical protein